MLICLFGTKIWTKNMSSKKVSNYVLLLFFITAYRRGDRCTSKSLVIKRSNKNKHINWHRWTTLYIFKYLCSYGRGLAEKRRGDGDQAPYFGAFHILKAISCKNLSAGIVRFPPFFMKSWKVNLCTLSLRVTACCN